MPRISAPEHCIVLHKARHVEMTAWCEGNLGPRWSAIDNRTGRWCCFWEGRKDPQSYRWLFSDERDLVWFALRWT